MRHYKVLAAAIYLFTLGASLHGLDIPLGASGGGEGQKIAYVDMERIFQVFPQTKYAKEDYAKRLRKMREHIDEKERELEEIQSRISVLETTFRDLEKDIQESTSTVAGEEDLSPISSPDSILALKDDLEKKKTELEEEKKRSMSDLNKFEKQQSQMILGKIYLALKDLAQEQQVTLVVDKSSILFGAANIDLTEALQKRVRGY